MKIFLAKSQINSLKNLKNSANIKPTLYKNIDRFNYFTFINSSKFSTSIKKKKLVEPNKIEEMYTTSSYLSEQNYDMIKNVKSDITQEKENKQSQLTKKFLMVVPIVFAPLCFHFPSDLVEGLFYSQFFHYSFQIAIKHLFLINTFNTGIILGYTMSLSDAEKNIDYQKILLRVGLTIASFFLCNALVSYQMNPYLFNGIYLSLMGSSIYIVKGINGLHPAYANMSSMIVIVAMTVMLLLINYYYKEWATKISEEGKFEETLRFYELSKDKEFVKVMDRIEKNLKEIDVKIARKKD
jgi:hypothetical protein